MYRVRIATVFIVCVFAILAFASFAPFTVSATTCIAISGSSNWCDNANKQCPKPDLTHKYDASKGKTWTEPYGNLTVTVNNLYGKACSETQNSVKVNGICTMEDKCKAMSYVGSDGKEHSVTDVEKTINQQVNPDTTQQNGEDITKQIQDANAKNPPPTGASTQNSQPTPTVGDNTNGSGVPSVFDTGAKPIDTFGGLGQPSTGGVNYSQELSGIAGGTQGSLDSTFGKVFDGSILGTALEQGFSHFTSDMFGAPSSYDFGDLSGYGIPTSYDGGGAPTYDTSGSGGGNYSSGYSGEPQYTGFGAGQNPQVTGGIPDDPQFAAEGTRIGPQAPSTNPTDVGGGPAPTGVPTTIGSTGTFPQGSFGGAPAPSALNEGDFNGPAPQVPQTTQNPWANAPTAQPPVGSVSVVPTPSTASQTDTNIGATAAFTQPIATNWSGANTAAPFSNYINTGGYKVAVDGFVTNPTAIDAALGNAPPQSGPVTTPTDLATAVSTAPFAATAGPTTNDLPVSLRGGWVNGPGPSGEITASNFGALSYGDVSWVNGDKTRTNIGAEYAFLSPEGGGQGFVNFGPTPAQLSQQEQAAGQPFLDQNAAPAPQGPESAPSPEFASASGCSGFLDCTRQKVSDAWDYVSSSVMGSAEAKPSDATIKAAAQGDTVTGDASVYNPNRPGENSGGPNVATGGRYNPNEYEAAIQTNIGRDAACGMGNTGTCYALVQSGDKAEVVKINDNGPLVGNRIIDLNQKSMDYFTGEKNSNAVLPDVKVTILNGDNYIAGPVDSKTLEALDQNTVPLPQVVAQAPSQPAIQNLGSDASSLVAGDTRQTLSPDIVPAAQNPRVAESAQNPLTDVNYAGLSTLRAVQEGSPLPDITPNYNAAIPKLEWAPDTQQAGAQITAEVNQQVQNGVPTPDTTQQSGEGITAQIQTETDAQSVRYAQLAREAALQTPAENPANASLVPEQTLINPYANSQPLENGYSETPPNKYANSAPVESTYPDNSVPADKLAQAVDYAKQNPAESPTEAVPSSDAIVQKPLTDQEIAARIPVPEQVQTNPQQLIENDNAITKAWSTKSSQYQQQIDTLQTALKSSDASNQLINNGDGSVTDVNAGMQQRLAQLQQEKAAVDTELTTYKTAGTLSPDMQTYVASRSAGEGSVSQTLGSAAASIETAGKSVTPAEEEWKAALNDPFAMQSLAGRQLAGGIAQFGADQVKAAQIASNSFGLSNPDQAMVDACASQPGGCTGARLVAVVQTGTNMFAVGQLATAPFKIGGSVIAKGADVVLGDSSLLGGSGTAVQNAAARGTLATDLVVDGAASEVRVGSSLAETNSGASGASSRTSTTQGPSIPSPANADEYFTQLSESGKAAPEAQPQVLKTANGNDVPQILRSSEVDGHFAGDGTYIKPDGTYRVEITQTAPKPLTATRDVPTTSEVPVRPPSSEITTGESVPVNPVAAADRPVPTNTTPSWTDAISNGYSNLTENISKGWNNFTDWIGGAPEPVQPTRIATPQEPTFVNPAPNPVATNPGINPAPIETAPIVRTAPEVTIPRDIAPSTNPAQSNAPAIELTRPNLTEAPPVNPVTRISPTETAITPVSETNPVTTIKPTPTPNTTPISKQLEDLAAAQPTPPTTANVAPEITPPTKPVVSTPPQPTLVQRIQNFFSPKAEAPVAPLETAPATTKGLNSVTDTFYEGSQTPAPKAVEVSVPKDANIRADVSLANPPADGVRVTLTDAESRVALANVSADERAALGATADSSGRTMEVVVSKDDLAKLESGSGDVTLYPAPKPAYASAVDTGTVAPLQEAANPGLFSGLRQRAADLWDRFVGGSNDVAALNPETESVTASPTTNAKQLDLPLGDEQGTLPLTTKEATPPPSLSEPQQLSLPLEGPQLELPLEQPTPSAPNKALTDAPGEGSRAWWAAPPVLVGVGAYKYLSGSDTAGSTGAPVTGFNSNLIYPPDDIFNPVPVSSANSSSATQNNASGVDENGFISSFPSGRSGTGSDYVSSKLNGVEVPVTSASDVPFPKPNPLKATQAPQGSGSTAKTSPPPAPGQQPAARTVNNPNTGANINNPTASPNKSPSWLSKATSFLGGFAGGFLGGMLGQQAQQQQQQAQPTQPAPTPSILPITTSTTSPTSTAPAGSAVTIVANPTSVTAGQTTTLTWAAVGPKTCAVFAPDNTQIGSGNPNGTTTTAAIATTTTFRITCTGGNGAASGQVTVATK